MSNNCLFCKIIAGEIPATKVYEDTNTLAFNDIDPQAPTHILLIHKKHSPAIHELSSQEISSYMGELYSTAQKVIEQENLAEKGYRIVLNSGKDGGQMVDHIHLHLLAGRSLQWPPG